MWETPVWLPVRLLNARMNFINEPYSSFIIPTKINADDTTVRP